MRKQGKLHCSGKKKGRVGGMGSGGGVVLLLRVQEAEKGVQESCGKRWKGEGGGSQRGWRPECHVFLV